MRLTPWHAMESRRDPAGGRPLIGVSTYLEAGRAGGCGSWRRRCCRPAYPRLVQRAGGLAAMLPPDDPAHAAATVARLDGLVIAGGPDVDPVRVRRRARPSYRPARSRRGTPGNSP